jgi:nucleoid-associated protein YgaU
MYQFPDPDDVMGDKEPEPLQNATRYKIIIIANLLLTLFIIATVWFFFFFNTTNPITSSSTKIKTKSAKTPAETEHVTGDFTPIITGDNSSEITTPSAIPTITPPIKHQENTDTKPLSDLDKITQELAKNKPKKAIEPTSELTLTDKNQVIIKQTTELPLEKLINQTKQNLNNFDQHLVNKLTKDDKTSPSTQPKSRNTALNNSITFEKANDMDKIMAAMGNINTSPEEQTLNKIDSTVKKLLKNEEGKLRASDAYTKKLLPETLENKKESRTITVKQGEKLWDIAVRAYGDGNRYKLILQANPLLKNNPKLIKAGAILRAPFIDYSNKSK